MGGQVLTAGIASGFTVAAALAGLAAVIALVVIQVRASDLERLQGAPAVPAPAAQGGAPMAASEAQPTRLSVR